MKMRTIKIRGDMIDVKKLRRAVENGLTGSAKAVLADLKVTTQTWKHQPAFVTESETGERRVYTDDEIYGYVDEGTPAHIITAKSPNKPLTFGIGGSPKTMPKVIGSRPGTRGTAIVRAQTVHHPGTAPRLFTDTVKEKWDDKLAETIQRSIDAEV
jgi:hypothetical protein